MLLIGLTFAGLYTSPPEGVTIVTLLICPADPDCTLERAHAGDGIVVGLDSLLALNVVKGGDAVSLGQTFSEQIPAARAAVLSEDWSAALIALDAAQRALANWTGVPKTQQLFDLYYLRGCVRLATKRLAADLFRQAATLAWNRSVVLPVETEPYASLYYNAQYRLLTEGLGTLVIQPVPGTRYFLDGVELGEAPLRVTVFPGQHRLNAEGPTGESWRAGVKVQAFRETTVTAELRMPDDVSWLTTLAGRMVDDREIDPELGELLDDWADHYGVRRVELRLVEPGIVGLDVDAEGAYAVRAVAYDPRLRRFGD